jgi:hypothetical protein
MAKKKRARMGRPPKAAAQRRTECVMIRLTKAEKRILEREARQLGLSLSAVILKPWRDQLEGE